MSLAARTLNRWLEGEAWARERLAAHAGRGFALEVGPSQTRFAIATEGTLTDEPSEASPPDLRLRISPLSVPAFLADPGRWDEFVIAEGDAALAATLRELAPTLPWLVEADFARALGPIVGRRVADAGRSALGMPGHVAERLIAHGGSWARDESQLLAHPAGMRELATGVDELSARAAAIESRISRLEGKPGKNGERE